MRTGRRTGWLMGAVAAALACSAASAADPVPSRDDLEAALARVAALEADHALARTRQPWIVLDLPAGMIRYRLMGLELRDVPLAGIETDGLIRRSDGTGTPTAGSLAGILVLKEKEDDPRLSPLTPAEAGSGEDDENSAGALPPEAPADYRLWFEQSIEMRIRGTGGGAGLGERLRGWWRSVRPWRAGGEDPAVVRLTIEVEREAAREIYRSLAPGSRFVLAPQPGYLLPEIGQPDAATIRPVGPRPRPAPPAPSVPKPEIEFQLPQPEEVTDEPPPELPPDTALGPPPDTALGPPRDLPPDTALGPPRDPAPDLPPDTVLGPPPGPPPPPADPPPAPGEEASEGEEAPEDGRDVQEPSDEEP